MAHALIDWSAPWLAPWAAAGPQVELAQQKGLPLHEALNLVNHGRPFGTEPAPVRFVAQNELPEGMAYESFVFRRGDAPVRPGAHDLFNGLCWMRFARTKARLNVLQAEAIAQAGVGAHRGPVRDALTLLDENAALLAAPPELWRALREHDWSRLFLELRPLWAQARLLLFGHALLEKLLAPRKAITAHVYPLDAALAQPGTSLAEVDAWLAGDLSAGRLAAKPFSPLPVLGVPGWWPANEQPGFYADTQVFRPPPQIRMSHVP